MQVEREALGGKGPRVRSEPSLAGHLLVFLPWGDAHKVSRRIRESAERERLVRALGAPAPGGGAFLVRTAAAGAGADALAAEAARLRARWEEIRAAVGGGGVPAVRHAELPARLRLLRDLERLDGVRIACDDPRDREEAAALVRERDPQAAGRVELYPEPGGLFEEGGLRRALARALGRRVWLPSGGTLAIEETEALVAVDVNTGRNLGKGGGAAGARRTVLETNLEACAELARQVRLRDLGGIVVVDFIDMADPGSASPCATRSATRCSRSPAARRWGRGASAACWSSPAGARGRTCTSC